MKKDILATVKQCHKYLSVFRTHIHTQRVYINHFCYNFISKKNCLGTFVPKVKMLNLLAKSSKAFFVSSINRHPTNNVRKKLLAKTIFDKLLQKYFCDSQDEISEKQKHFGTNIYSAILFIMHESE